MKPTIDQSILEDMAILRKTDYTFKGTIKDFPKQNIDVEIEMPSPEPEKDEPSATDIAGVAIILT